MTHEMLAVTYTHTHEMLVTCTHMSAERRHIAAPREATVQFWAEPRLGKQDVLGFWVGRIAWCATSSAAVHARLCPHTQIPFNPAAQTTTARLLISLGTTSGLYVSASRPFAPPRQSPSSTPSPPVPGAAVYPFAPPPPRSSAPCITLATSEVMVKASSRLHTPHSTQNRVAMLNAAMRLGKKKGGVGGEWGVWGGDYRERHEPPTKRVGVGSERVEGKGGARRDDDRNLLTSRSFR